MSEVANIILTFRVNSETRRAIEQEAGRRGVTVGEFLRQSALAQIGKDDIDSLQKSFAVMISRAMRQSMARGKHRKLRVSKSA